MEYKLILLESESLFDEKAGTAEPGSEGSNKREKYTHEKGETTTIAITKDKHTYTRTTD
jgi:hypothetical protein